MNEKRYTFVVKFDITYVYDEQGKPLPSSEYDELINHLHEAKLQQRAAEGITWAQSLALQGHWVFPQQRREIYKAGPCVYFLTASEYPGFIKIGKSAQLTTRTQTLKREHRSEIKVTAFAKTDDIDDAERALHALFRRYRSGASEWFTSAPVLEFLNVMREAVR